MKEKESLELIIQNYVQRSIELQEKTFSCCFNDILNAVDLIRKCFENNKKLLLCGNGGSAADCQHFASELVGIFRKEHLRAGFPAISLTTDTSLLTAYSNDFSFEYIFQRQVETLGQPGDTLICISTSGKSQNIINAAHIAKEKHIKTIALTGQNGILSNIVDICIAVPSDTTSLIQESHIVIEHVICLLLEELSGSGDILTDRT